MRKEGRNHPDEMELVSDPESAGESHLPVSIPPRIESEIPASENDLIPAESLGDHQPDSRGSEARPTGQASEEENDEESAALLGSKEVTCTSIVSKGGNISEMKSQPC